LSGVRHDELRRNDQRLTRKLSGRATAEQQTSADATAIPFAVGYEILAEFLQRLKQSTEGDHSLPDRTAALYTSNLGNSSSRDNNNLPILLAGGDFKHQGHIAFDTRSNTYLSNLFVRMLHHMGIEATSFGASNGEISEI
jgi:hypothetical protein